MVDDSIILGHFLSTDLVMMYSFKEEFSDITFLHISTSMTKSFIMKHTKSIVIVYVIILVFFVESTYIGYSGSSV